jgi:putative membrane protein
MPDRPSGTDPNNPINNPDTMTMRKVDDKKFLKDAAVGGMMEVELGKLATQKGSSDGVKKFGQKMVDDHSKANDQLKELATKENLQVPSELDSKHQSRLDKLSKLDGPAFDKAYIKDQLKDHEQDVSAFQSEAQNGQDANVKQFAAATLPTLQEHLSMAKDLKKENK